MRNESQGLRKGLRKDVEGKTEGNLRGKGRRFKMRGTVSSSRPLKSITGFKIN